MSKLLNQEFNLVKDFSLTENSKEIEDKIFNAKSDTTGLIENNNDYIFYNIENITSKSPDLNNEQSYSEMQKLVFEKNKFDFNRKILEEINDKSFDQAKFDELGNSLIKSITLNSVKDNKKFNINSVRVLYSLPIGSFTLVNDDKNNIYLSKNESLSDEMIDYESPEYKSFVTTQLSNDRKNILQSYDTFLNNKYTVDINQKTLERVKNYFK